MPGTHARLSPSAADRWFECPGAPNAELDQPEQPSPAADEGTTAHALLEKSLGHRQPPQRFDDMPGVNQEMIGHATTAWHLVAGMQAGCDRLAVEMKVDPGQLFGRGDLWGTADTVIEQGNHLVVLDFKYGTWPVNPIENKQLMIYAIGAAAQSLQRIEAFTLGIIQPRTDGPPLKLWQVSRDDMLIFAHELKAAAAATDDPMAARAADTQGHCFYCRARDTCPEYKSCIGI